MPAAPVFISYAAEDGAFCAELAGALHAAGADVWHGD